MECNKDEALRAKVIAEQKISVQDYDAAKKFLLKATRLDPQLQEAQQLLAVADVHLKARVKIFGELDWYGILGAEPSSEDSFIKRQYRKLALSLHPDKNKFPGAEEAFKLIGEASAVLSDKDKRNRYDQALHQRSKSTSVNLGQTRVVPTGNTGSSRVSPRQPLQRHPAGASNAYSNAFWTTCSHCAMHYQYERNYLNCRLYCQNCKLDYVASESVFGPGRNGASPRRAAAAGSGGGVFRFGSGSAGPQTSAYVKQVFEQARKDRQEESRKKKEAAPSVVEMFKRTSRRAAAATMKGGGKQQAAAAAEEKATPKPDEPEEKVKPETNAEEGERKTTPAEEQQPKCVNNSEAEHKPEEMEEEDPQQDENHSRKRKRVVDDDDDDDEDETDEKSSKLPPGGRPRRSSRRKRVISYNFDADDDEDLEAFPARKKSSASEASECPSQASKSVQLQKPQVEEEEEEEEEVEKNDHSDEQPPSFDFDEHRVPEKIKKGQVWAVYEELGQPRWYARVESSRGKKFQVKWLEPINVSEEEMEWLRTGHYMSCGEFQVSKERNTLESAVFCQEMKMEEGGKIYPREGEVWAVYHEWSREWIREDAGSRDYRYVAVEILSGFSEKGLKFARLRRVEGRVTYFARENEAGWEVCGPEQMLRFSHRIPAVRVGHRLLPPGSLQLDTEAIEKLVQ